MSMFNNKKQMPDFSEMLSNYFGGNDKKKKPSDKATLKRAGKRR